MANTRGALASAPLVHSLWLMPKLVSWGWCIPCTCSLVVATPKKISYQNCASQSHERRASRLASPLDGKRVIIRRLIVLIGRHLDDHEPALDEEEDRAKPPAKKVLHVRVCQNAWCGHGYRHGTQHEEQTAHHVEHNN